MAQSNKSQDWDEPKIILLQHRICSWQEVKVKRNMLTDRAILLCLYQIQSLLNVKLRRRASKRGPRTTWVIGGNQIFQEKVKFWEISRLSKHGGCQNAPKWLWQRQVTCMNMLTDAKMAHLKWGILKGKIDAFWHRYAYSCKWPVSVTAILGHFGNPRVFWKFDNFRKFHFFLEKIWFPRK